MVPPRMFTTSEYGWIVRREDLPSAGERNAHVVVQSRIVTFFVVGAYFKK